MTKQLSTRLVALAFLAFGALSLAGCAARSIDRIVADPIRYRDKDVKVSGRVADSYSLMDRGIYRIEDQTGELWVVSSRGVPSRGARVDVKGTVRQGFNLGIFERAIPLPAALSDGLVLVESSHEVR
jgi:hypothetical protein